MKRAIDQTSWIIALLGAVMFLAPLGQTIYAPSMAIVRDELMTTNALAGASVAAYGVGLALSQILYGPLVDRYDAKWILLAGIAIYLVGSIGGALAPTIEVLIVARGAQAMGIGASLVVCPAVVGDLVPPNRRGRAMGLFASIALIAPAAGPVIGAIIASAFSWRADLIALTIAAALAIAGVLWLLPAHRASAISLSPQQIRKVLVSPTVIGCAALGFAQLMTLHSYLTLLPVLFRDRFGLSELAIGPLLTSMTICLAIGAAIGGRISDRVGRRAVLLVGGVGAVFASLGVLAMAHFASPGNLASAVVPLLFLGASISVNLPTQTSLLVDWFPDLRGTALAVYNFLRFVGAALGPIVAGLVADQAGTSWAFLPGSVALGLAAVAATWLVRNPPRAIYEAPAAQARTT